MGVKVYFKPLNNLFWSDDNTNLTKSGYFDEADTPIWIVDQNIASDPSAVAGVPALNANAQTIVVDAPVSYDDTEIDWSASGFGRTATNAADKASFHLEVLRNWLSQTFANPTINPFGESINAHIVKSSANAARTGCLVYFGNQSAKDFAPAYWNGNDSIDETVHNAIHSYWTAPQGAVEVSEGLPWDMHVVTQGSGATNFTSNLGNTVIHLTSLDGQMTIGSDGTASASTLLTPVPAATLVMHIVAKATAAVQGTLIDANYVSTVGGFKLDIAGGNLVIGATDESVAFSPDLGNWHVYTIVFDANADQARLYVDGVQAGGSVSAGSGAHNLANNDPLTMFSNTDQSGLQSGEIADIVIYDAVSAAWAGYQKDLAAQAIACASYKYDLELLFATNL